MRTQVARAVNPQTVPLGDLASLCHRLSGWRSAGFALTIRTERFLLDLLQIAAENQIDPRVLLATVQSGASAIQSDNRRSAARDEAMRARVKQTA